MGAWGKVKGALSKATGVDEGTIDKVATVAAPVAAAHQYVGSGQAQKDIQTGINTATKTEPTYNVRTPDALKAPVFPAGAKPVSMALPQAFKGGQVATVAGPAAPDFSGSKEGIGLQSGLAQRLNLQSQGQGPSVAAEQFKQAQAANQAAAYSMMASQRGGPTAAGARTAAMTSAEIQAKTAQDAALARMQEQQNAQNALAGVTSSMRAGNVAEVGLTSAADIAGARLREDQAVTQAQLDQDTANRLFAAQNDAVKTNALFQSEYNNRVDKYVQMGLDVASAQQRAEVELEAIRAKVPRTKSGLEQAAGVASQVAPLAQIFAARGGEESGYAPSQDLSNTTANYNERGEGETYMGPLPKRNAGTYTA